MAARNSCTHMTWAEAKNKSGVGGSKSGKNKAGGNIKRENHGRVLAAKIVQKAGPSKEQHIEDRQAARRARRDQQRQEQLEAQRQAAKEQQRLESVAKPHEQALEKLTELAWEYQEKTLQDIPEATTDADQYTTVCESKQLQSDELMALEAIFDGMDLLVVNDSSGLEELQSKLDDWQMDPDSMALQKAVVEHPPLSYTMKRSVDDPSDDDWIVHMLLQVTCPENYPLETTPPSVQVLCCLLTQKSLVVADNKPLESMGHLDEAALTQAWNEQAGELLGMPSVYELLDTWLVENIFQYVARNPVLAS